MAVAATATTTTLTIIVNYLAEKLLLRRQQQRRRLTVPNEWNEIELVAHIKQHPRPPRTAHSRPFLHTLRHTHIRVLKLLTSSTYIVVYGPARKFQCTFKSTCSNSKYWCLAQHKHRYNTVYTIYSIYQIYNIHILVHSTEHNQFTNDSHSQIAFRFSHSLVLFSHFHFHINLHFKSLNLKLTVINGMSILQFIDWLWASIIMIVKYIFLILSVDSFDFMINKFFLDVL